MGCILYDPGKPLRKMTDFPLEWESLLSLVGLIWPGFGMQDMYVCMCVSYHETVISSGCVHIGGGLGWGFRPYFMQSSPIQAWIMSKSLASQQANYKIHLLFFLCKMTN